MTDACLFRNAHWNILAAQIKKHLFTTAQNRQIHSQSMLNFTLSLTKRLKLDNPNFDPIDFLEHCSPDPELYPLQELWDETS